MLSRSSFGRTAQRALRTSSRRAFASAASPSTQYETAEAAGIKVANRELEGATSLLAVVAKAGSRYEPVPGFSDALARYAFQVRHLSFDILNQLGYDGCLHLFYLVYIQTIGFAYHSRGRASR